MATLQRMVPASGGTAEILTYEDVLEHLQSFLGTSALDRGTRAIRQAVQSALRTIVSEHNWSYLFTKYRIHTVAAYSTGTITYTHATRVIDGSGTAFPEAWSAGGDMLINNVLSRVELWTDANTLKLGPNNNPGADVAAGTSYSLQRSQFPLPADFVRLGPMTREVSAWLGTYISPQEWMELERWQGTTGTPYLYTIASSPDLMGQHAIFMYPAPNEVKSHDIMYVRRPLRAIHSGKAANDRAGTIDTSGSNTGVVGTGTAFTSSMVGAVLREGTAANLPTGEVGQNPYAYQRVIREFTNATTLVMASDKDASRTGVKYTISTPIDIDPVMIDAFLRCCEKHVAMLLQMKNLESIAATYEGALLDAKAADQRVMERRYVNQYSGSARRIADIPLADDIP